MTPFIFLVTTDDLTVPSVDSMLKTKLYVSLNYDSCAVLKHIFKEKIL